jgi:hypothetical protein
MRAAFLGRVEVNSARVHTIATWLRKQSSNLEELLTMNRQAEDATVS